MKSRLPALVAGFALAVAPAMATPIPNQVDDFEDGTTQNWRVGIQNPNVPVNVPNGQGGPTDDFLQMTATGGFGGGSKLGVLNTNQWTGDYIANGITSIQADFRVLSGPDLEMRLLLQGGGAEITSTVSQPLPADGLWHTLTFNVTPADFTAIFGSVNNALQNATLLLIRHQPGAPGGAGAAPSVTASVGMDNVLAIPEPATLALLAFGGMTLIRRKR